MDQVVTESIARRQRAVQLSLPALAREADRLAMKIDRYRAAMEEPDVTVPRRRHYLSQIDAIERQVADLDTIMVGMQPATAADVAALVRRARKLSEDDAARRMLDAVLGAIETR